MNLKKALENSILGWLPKEPAQSRKRISTNPLPLNTKNASARNLCIRMLATFAVAFAIDYFLGLTQFYSIITSNEFQVGLQVVFMSMLAVWALIILRSRRRTM